MNRNLLTHKRLLETLRYDPDTGLFTRLVQLAARALKGSIAGSVGKDGRRRIRLDKEQFFAARLAWFYMTGEWPKGEVDHIDLNRSDDRFVNLRIATHQQNNVNRRVLRNNRLGVKGVSKVNGRYRAQIWVNNQRRHLGYYSTIDDAKVAYAKVAREHFGEFARPE